MSGVMLAVLIIAAVLLLLALLALFWWLRTQSGTAVRSFYAAVRKMEREQDRESRYQTPWLMLLGDPQEGRQLCVDWQLTPAGRPAWFGRWWADPDGSLLVVPQSLFLPREDSMASLHVWRGLLRILLRIRGQRPLDGVIWNVPLAQLQNMDELDALVMRRRFADLQQYLGLNLPVHVLISGLEALPGFQELVAALPQARHERMLGWTSPHGLDGGWQNHWLDDAVDEVIQALQAAIIEIGALKGEVHEELYQLPERLQELKGTLRTLLAPVFQSGTHGDAAKLRGIYLSAAQAHTESREGLLANERPLAQGVFSNGLWRQRFLVERGLARPVPRILRLRQRWQKVMAGAALVLGAFWLVAMLWVWKDSQQDARQLSRLVQTTHNSHVRLLEPVHGREQAQQNVSRFWSLLQQSPRWHFSSLVFPTSWFSSFDTQMDRALSGIARREVIQPLEQMQRFELERLLAIRNQGRRTDTDGGRPDEWENYVKARSLAEGIVSLERRSRWLNEAFEGEKGMLEPLVLLSNDALGLGLDTSTLPRRNHYEVALRELAASGMQPLELQGYRQRFSEQFQTLMKLWLAQYFLAGSFVAPAGYLKAYLEDIKEERGVSLRKLENINGHIHHLEDLITLTNSAWSHGSSEELVPGYRLLLDNVRQSSLLGPTVEESLNNEAERLRRGFHNQWIEGAGSRNNLLQRQAGGTLALQEHVNKLGRSIEVLLRRDFVVAALRRPAAERGVQDLGKVGEQQLSQALGYHQSYRDFVTQELAQIPPDYRAGVLEAAGEGAALAMWSALSSSPQRYGSTEGKAFSVSVDQAMQVMQALGELGRTDLAATLQAQLSRSAIADVDAALATIDTQPLFTQRYDVSAWNGEPNLGLLLFRSTDVQDLKQYLARQFATIASSAESAVPELTWLRAQPMLSLETQDKVSRLASLNEELLKYKAQNPTSSPALFEQLVSRDLVEMDGQTCRQVLATASMPHGDGDLARRTRSLREQAERRCSDLQAQGAAQAWSHLADYFNQYLAGRFPFSYSLADADADPARVQHLLNLIDAHLQQAEQGLAWARPGDRPAAEDFLSRLKQARTWLGPLFVRDKSGLLGVEMEVRWRTDRADERGADQVIAWSLHAAEQHIEHPGDEAQRLHWNVGEPMQLLLRWARDGNQRPLIDPLQPSMAVHELEAGWEYRGPWALLRMMRSHVLPQRLPSMDYTDFPLTLQVPVQGAWGGNPQAQMFMRLSLLSQGSNLPLSIQPLPVLAPRSPFVNLSSVPLASSQAIP